MRTICPGPKRLRRRRLCRFVGAFAVTFGPLLVGCDRSEPKLPESVTTTSSEKTEADAAGPSVRFEDVTSLTGIDSVYWNGEDALQRSIVESLGGGVGLFDFDRDGLLDVFFPGGGELVPDQPLAGKPSGFWRNLGEMKFANAARSAAVDEVGHYTHGCAMGDYDADGFQDILLTGYGGLTLYRNQGDGTFEEVTLVVGLDSKEWSSSAAWADFNRDGHLDLFIANYVDWSWEKNPKCFAGAERREICSPQDFSPLLDLVYLSNGDGTFRGCKEECGLTEAGKGLGVLAVDVNRDGAMDVYVANDTTPNLMFMNDGTGNFQEAGVLRGTAYDQRGVSNGSMGVAVLDYNNDAQPDIWVTNYENETFALYHNDRDGMFRCLTENTGITALGTLYVGFGTIAADFTLSGNEDIVVSNGHVMMYPNYSEIQQDALYLRNDGRGRISKVDFPKDSYFGRGHRGRGVVTGDLDQDGKLDLVFSHVNEPASILRQTSDLSGQFIEIELVGTACCRDGIGASVMLTTDKRTRFRQVFGGGSYLSQNPYTVHFGVPVGDVVKEVKIEWPDGTEQQIKDLQIGQRTVVVQKSAN